MVERAAVREADQARKNARVKVARMMADRARARRREEFEGHGEQVVSDWE